MKTVSLLLIAATVLCGSQSNAQFSDLCLSQPMREVPITLQIKRAAGLAACSDDGLLALPQLASEAEEQIISKYQPSPQYSSCRLVSLEHTSCESLGRRGQRILIHYKANITCSDGCYYLSGFNQKDSDAISLYLSQVDSLVDAVRAKPSAEFNYGSRLVEIFYFRGRKEGVFSACSGVTVQDGVNKKIPACRCPSNCSNPCTLPAEPGRCRGRFPRYYHNSDSGQCELFTYGGCDGNQNRFNTQEECETACKVCPSGKVYLECGTDCPDTCENKDVEIRICNLRCVQGCFCPAGTVELGDECVAPDECPSTNTTAVEEECPEGKIYKQCGSACPVTCDNKDETINCITVCAPGCFCPAGTVELGDKCVAPEECPSTSTTAAPEKQCSAGMVYEECGTACPTTCENKDELIRPCTLQCVQGCFCPADKVLLEEDGETKCVDREECPSEVEECPEGKIYKECGTACPLTCENKDDDIICTKQCVPGCFCPSGYVERGNSCVTPKECDAELCSLPPETGPCKAYFPRYFYNTTSEQCEQFIYGGCRGNGNNFQTVEECEAKCNETVVFECLNGKEYQECGTSCPITCDNKDEIRICTLECVQGCFCPADTVELDDKCVAPEECPSTNTTTAPEKQCSAGMVYEECGTACPTTCENKDVLIRPCTLQCVQGCFCPADKVLLEEDGETKCVDREECPSEVEECPEGKIYKECGTACPLTCENKDDDIICTKQCVPGCFCPSGYVERGNSCVTPKECDAELCSLRPKTGPCKAAFRRYFYNPASEQCEQFIYGGCQGNENNFRTVEECEAKCNETEVFECPNGKEYQECGTSCPTTCENKDEIRICPFECVQGCFCPAGTVELDDKCVTPEECPSTNTTAPPEKLCPQGMVYEECGTACPTTCDNKDVLVRPCTLQCVQGCFCAGDSILLEEEGDECVTRDQCPT